jgi:drug/metabolite transporter superfamily protein YnfA
MITGFFVAGLVTVLGMLITMARMDIRKWLGYSNIVDVCCAAMLVVLFSGSFGGVVAAAFAGMFMSLSLWVLRSTLGYKKFQRVGLRMRWVYYKPTMRWSFNFGSKTA